MKVYIDKHQTDGRVEIYNREYVEKQIKESQEMGRGKGFWSYSYLRDIPENLIYQYQALMEKKQVLEDKIADDKFIVREDEPKKKTFGGLRLIQGGRSE